MKDNQYQFFENFQKNNLESIRNDLKNQFEAIDQEIFLSSWRKNKGYIPDGFKSRTLITIYGLITFRRRIYKYWDKYRYRYVFLADKKLQIERYSRVTSHLKFKILEQISSGKRQRDIADMFLHAKLTRVTISKIISNFNLKEPIKITFDDDNYAKAKITNYLYINMDETFINLRKNKKVIKYRIRLVTFHTGYHKMYSTSKRKVLANKRVFLKLIPVRQKINTADFVDEVYHMAKKFYLGVDSSKIIIGGDGASWIRTISSYLPNSHYVLDKFHAIRYLKNLFRSNQENYFASKKFFELGNFDSLISFLKNTPIETDKFKRLKEILSYFRNNKLGIINQSLDWNIGVCAEADISHIVKWLLGYGAKGFNFKTFKNMLLLRCAEINKLDIISYLKNEYQESKQEKWIFYKQNLWIRKNRKDDFAVHGEWLNNKITRNKWKYGF